MKLRTAARGRPDSEVSVTQPTGPDHGQAGSGADPRRRPGQLPGGRHGLLPSYVAANQRERILSAVARASADLGYGQMSVEAIIARAGVSRRTFYEHFKNKEDAFLGAYDAVVHEAVRYVRRAYLKETTALARLRAGIGAFLQFLASDPEVARMGIVEVFAAGPRAIARRDDARRLFAEIIEENIHELVPSVRHPELTAETIVGGIFEVVFTRILTSRADELPGLADDLLVAILMLDVNPDELSTGSGSSDAQDSRPSAQPPGTAWPG